MSVEVGGVVLTKEQRDTHREEDYQPERPDLDRTTARMLSDAIVRLYRLTGWPPGRVALELAAGTGGSRRDVLRWAREGVPVGERQGLWARVEELEDRHLPQRPWAEDTVERLRERRGLSRLDLAIEADLTVERVKELERGARPSRAEARRIREAGEEGTS